MKNSDIVPPPTLKINCWMYCLFLTPLLEFYAATYSSQPITLCKPCPRIHVRNGMRFPLVAPLGSRIPFLDRILGCNFHRASQPETASHSKGKFRDTASATPPIRKSHPIPHTSGHRAISLLGLPSIKGRPRVKKKASRISRLSRLCYFERATAIAYSPSTAFFATTAMLSRSSLVGWSFAATQLSSSNLARALSGSCSSMAS